MKGVITAGQRRHADAEEREPMTSSFRSLEQESAASPDGVTHIILIIFSPFCWDEWAAFNGALDCKIMSG